MISLLQLKDHTHASDVTFLTEALPTVLTDVRFFPRVEFHVVPQRARVSQKLAADCALHLGEEKHKSSTSSFLLIKHFHFKLLFKEEKEGKQDWRVNLKMLRE